MRNKLVKFFFFFFFAKQFVKFLVRASCKTKSACILARIYDPTLMGALPLYN